LAVITMAVGTTQLKVHNRQLQKIPNFPPPGLTDRHRSVKALSNTFSKMSSGAGPILNPDFLIATHTSGIRLLMHLMKPGRRF
jgi:hypothetical protein